MRRAAYALTAVVLFALALALVVSAGLPERAAFTGHVLPSGHTVAPEVGSLAPPFEAQTVDGSTIALSDLRGSPVVVNFWATWCVPCRAEMPELEALYQAHQARGLRVVGINVGDSVDDVLDWRDNLALTFDLVLDPTSAIADRYLLRGQPTTFVLSPDGAITSIVYGATSQSALEAALAPYLTSATTLGIPHG